MPNQLREPIPVPRPIEEPPPRPEWAPSADRSRQDAVDRLCALRAGLIPWRRP